MSTLTTNYLANLGVSMQEALAFVLANVNSNPREIYDTCVKYGISSQMLAEIVEDVEPGADANAVRNFFHTLGLEGTALDLAYFDTLKANSKLSSYGTINDTITLGEGNDYVDGGIGDDKIYGNGGNDVLLGGSGDDWIEGGWGADYIEGGTGADTLHAGAESVYVYGYYLGNRWVNGYYNYDVSQNVVDGGGGADKVYGGYGGDILYGGDGADIIYGSYRSAYDESVWLLDNDLIYGDDGDDQIYGEYGSDIIYGGAGSDRIYGGYGADTLYGGEGDDYIYAWESYYNDDNVRDTIFGGDGNDTIYVSNGDWVDAGAGNDRIAFSGGSGTDAVTEAVIVAGDGADTISLSGLSDTSHVILDLTEVTQSKDVVTVSADRAVDTALEIIGFDLKYDTFELNYFNLYGSNYSKYSAGYVSRYSSESYAQILASPSADYILRSKSPSTPDSYGKGFFVIQGASATDSGIVSAAALIDSYGNNAAYANKASHYFLINIGDSDSALYLFKDDTGADNKVVADELAPIAYFVGVRTEDYTMADLISVFV